MARIAVIAGDGIGPEVMAEALPLLAWAKGRGADLEWREFPFGAHHVLATGETLPEEAFLDLRDRHDAILFGAVGDPRVPDGRHAEQILLRLRRDLDLRVNFRPCRPFLDAHVPLRARTARDIHLEVFRENTEGPYGLRGRSGPEEAVDEAHHSVRAVTSLLRAAFERAQSQGLPLTLAHKANVLKHGHGLWLRVFQSMKADFPDVQAQALLADALMCALVQDPRPFGVIAADNLFGDLLSDLLAAFQGGMGLAASGNLAPHRPFRCAGLFEPVHGSAPDIAGRDLANPCGMILSTALMFHHLGLDSEGLALTEAVREALTAGHATRDLGGTLGTRAMGSAIRSRLPA